MRVFAEREQAASWGRLPNCVRGARPGPAGVHHQLRRGGGAGAAAVGAVAAAAVGGSGAAGGSRRVQLAGEPRPCEAWYTLSMRVYETVCIHCGCMKWL